MDPTVSTASHSDETSDPRRVFIGVRILAHPDPSRVGDYAPLLDPDCNGTVTISRTGPMFRHSNGEASGCLLTNQVSRQPVQVTRKGSSYHFQCSDPGVKVEIDGVPIQGSRDIALMHEQQGVTVLLGRHVALWLGRLELAEPVPPIAGLIGESSSMRRLRREVFRIASTDVPVLLRGETGVGKEIVASSIHALSRRAARPYVAVNLAALPISMAAAELFGHNRGAFTGASAGRAGYFEQADGGSLFLDEIGDVAPDIQPLLLRAIQHGTIQPLGGQLRQVDVRLIAATDSDLEAAVARGTFREPLLRRFAYEMFIPPLRERSDDIGLLFDYLLQQQLVRIGVNVPSAHTEHCPTSSAPAAFIAQLARYHWPGNVRELANVALQYALTHGTRAPSRVDPMIERLLQRPNTQPRPGSWEHEDPARTSMLVAAPPKRPPNEISDDTIERALAAAGYSVERAAKKLSVSRSYLYKRVAPGRVGRRALDLSIDEITTALDKHVGNVRQAADELQVSKRALALQIARLGMAEPKAPSNDPLRAKNSTS